MARRRRRRRRIEHWLLGAAVTSAAVLALMLATGAGVRDDDAATEPPLATTIPSTTTTRPAITPTAPTTLVVPVASMPTQTPCGALAQIAALEPTHTRLTRALRTVARRPDDTRATQQAILAVDEYRLQHLPGFLAWLHVLGQVEPALTDGTTSLGTFMEEGIARLDPLQDGPAIAAEFEGIGEAPGFSTAMEGVSDIARYGDERCGLTG